MNWPAAQETPYDLLSEQLNELAHYEVELHGWNVFQGGENILDRSNLMCLRLQFLQNYLEFFLTHASTKPCNPLGYPNGQAKLLFHLDVMDQMDAIDKDLSTLQENDAKIPDALILYKDNLIATIDESLDCHTPESFQCLQTRYLKTRQEAIFPCLKSVN